MPYRVDVRALAADAFERLVDLGAIDAELLHGGRIAALMPDSVPPEEIARVLGVSDVSVSPAVSRDAGSVWVLRTPPIQVGRLRIVPAHMEREPGTIRLIDAAAFGTGLHPTTALCLEMLQETVQDSCPDAVLDVGTGSGVLAIGALVIGVPRALGIDIDDEALRVASANARLNGVDSRLQLARGGPEAIAGSWSLVVANVLAAPLMEMAPSLVRRLGHQGRLVLSGIPLSIEPDVTAAYGRLGLRLVSVNARAGWVALVLQASW